MNGNRWLAAWVLAVAQPLPGWAQPIIDMGDSIACTCEIRATLRVTIRDDDGRGGLAAPMTMARLSDGRFLLVPTTQQDRILLFAADGTFERQIGRSGQGPGEYLAVLKLERTSGDSILVLDTGNGRMTLLGPDLSPVRSAQVMIRGGQVESLSDGSVLLLSGLSGVGEPLLPRLHLLDPLFEPVRSFMQEATRSADGNPAGARRRMTSTRDGTIAVVHTNRYVAEIWSTDGVHHKTLTRSPEWFSEAEAFASDVGAPPTVLGDPYFDAEGRLWTITYVSDANWEPGLRPFQAPTGAILGPGPGAGNAAQDTWIEVLDINENAVLASRRFDARIRFMLDERFAAGYREDDVGNPFVDVWELELVGR